MAGLTPMMKQYLEIHEEVKDAILFFRLGDFYEMFFDDAITASKELEIALTSRECGLEEKAPMCGVPYHSAENYIAKLIEKGYKVAICEQVEDPREAKGLVKREVVQVISPGTVNDGRLLEDKKNNFLMSIYYNMNDFGLAIVDVSTGEFKTTEVKNASFLREKLLDEIGKYNPSELIINTIFYKDKILMEDIKKKFSCYIDILDNKYFQIEGGKEKLKEQFSVYSMTALGIEDDNLSIQASGALISYLQETQKRALSHINHIEKYEVDNYMALDISTRRNLELTENMRSNEKKGSLIHVLDKTLTSMGGRKLKQWIHQPLINVNRINERLDAVETILKDMGILLQLEENLKKIYDLERLISKISFGNCNGRDFLSLKSSLSVIPDVKDILNRCNNKSMEKLNKKLDPLEDIVDLLERSIHPEPPASVKEGNIIKDGFNEEVDYYRDINLSGKDYIIDLENRERDRTGIKSLKIKFNKVFNYYIEITKSNLHLVPGNYIRKQTLANSERYYTEELKEIEEKILNAEGKIVDLEYDIFNEIRHEVIANINRIKITADVISTLDVLYSFGKISYENNYIRPTVEDSKDISITEGRHPVVENMLNAKEFVPNSTQLDCQENQMIIITGPNMAGKSTYIRQVAIITLMAQIGCYVPAEEAVIGAVDRIFTRVGASDDLALGQSTFMVEMSEVSNILKNATSNSLIILDEIGRGTSTYDGLSIAWSVVEYINDKKKLGAKALFATHYHELTQLEGVLKGVKNYCIRVEEREDGVIFLRKIARGQADQSYGIEVAKLAGLPDEVVKRANEILKNLEKPDVVIEPRKEKVIKNDPPINLFNYQEKEIIQSIKDMPIEDMSPIEVMNYVYKLKGKLN